MPKTAVGDLPATIIVNVPQPMHKDKVRLAEYALGKWRVFMYEKDYWAAIQQFEQTRHVIVVQAYVYTRHDGRFNIYISHEDIRVCP